LPEVARQIVMLVVGTHFRADYEIYAHSAVARAAGISEEQIKRSSEGIGRRVCLMKQRWLMMRRQLF